MLQYRAVFAPYVSPHNLNAHLILQCFGQGSEEQYRKTVAAAIPRRADDCAPGDDAPHHHLNVLNVLPALPRQFTQCLLCAGSR